MNALEKNRWICFGKEATYSKDSRIAALQEDFARHFKDSIDYQPEAKINGKQQELIVAKNKSVTNERRIIAYPGETFYAGDVVDALNAKWLVTEVDQNKEVYTKGIMQICNRELIWQNRNTGEILRRWVTAEKPYYSNLDEAKPLTVSSREYKIQVTFDEETSLIDIDKRFMLEIIGESPKTYKVTSVDTITDRFYMSGDIRGFLVLNVTQDLYNPKTDRKDLLICDYIEPSVAPDPTPDQTTEGTITFTYSGSATIRQGGSAKKFTAHLYDAEGNEVNDAAFEWHLEVDPVLAEKFTLSPDGDFARISALDYVELQGVTVQLIAKCGNVTGSIDVEVVS